jgi:hypothetical protein
MYLNISVGYFESTLPIYTSDFVTIFPVGMLNVTGNYVVILQI